MKGSRRLRPVARIAQHRERDAARQLGNSLRQAEQQQKQLDSLIEYRDQYVTSFKNAGEQGLSAVQMRDYQLFLRRLDSAIMQQQQKLVASRQDCDLSQADWQNKHGHSKMIDKVVEKREQTETHKLDAQEQRELDDRPKNSYNSDRSDD